MTGADPPASGGRPLEGGEEVQGPPKKQRVEARTNKEVLEQFGEVLSKDALENCKEVMRAFGENGTELADFDESQWIAVVGKGIGQAIFNKLNAGVGKPEHQHELHFELPELSRDEGIRRVTEIMKGLTKGRREAKDILGVKTNFKFRNCETVKKAVLYTLRKTEIPEFPEIPEKESAAITSTSLSEQKVVDEDEYMADACVPRAPIICTHASPGMGKSRLILEMISQVQRVGSPDEYYPLIVTYSSHTKALESEKSNPQLALAARIIWGLVAEELMDIKSVLKSSFAGVPDVLHHVLNYLIEVHGKVVLFIDEFAAAYRAATLRTPLQQFLDDSDTNPNFFLFVTSLRRKIFDISEKDETRSANRPVHWVKLLPMDVPEILSHPLASIEVERVAHFCGGHPRSLQLLHALYTSYPEAGVTALTEYLLDEVSDWFRKGSMIDIFSGAAIEVVLCGEEVSVRFKPPDSKHSYDFYASNGYILCSLEDDVQRVGFSPILLYLWMRDTLRTRKQHPQRAVSLAEKLRPLFVFGNTFRGVDFEIFHSNYDLLRSFILLGEEKEKEISLAKYFLKCVGTGAEDIKWKLRPDTRIAKVNFPDGVNSHVDSGQNVLYIPNNPNNEGFDAVFVSDNLRIVIQMKYESPTSRSSPVTIDYVKKHLEGSKWNFFKNYVEWTEQTVFVFMTYRDLHKDFRKKDLEKNVFVVDKIALNYYYGYSFTQFPQFLLLDALKRKKYQKKEPPCIHHCVVNEEVCKHLCCKQKQEQT